MENFDKVRSNKTAVCYGNRVGAAMERRGLTLGQLRQKTGISKSHLSLIRRGKRQPSPETYEMIRDELGVEAISPNCGSFYADDESETTE